MPFFGRVAEVNSTDPRQGLLRYGYIRARFQSAINRDCCAKRFASWPANNPSWVTSTVRQPRAAAPKISVCKVSPHIAIRSCATPAQCRFDQVIYFWKGFAKETHVIWELIGNEVPKMTGFQRETIIARGGKISIRNQHRARAAIK